MTSVAPDAPAMGSEGPELPDALTRALSLMRRWVTDRPTPFLPQEQTLQAWLGMALVQTGYCAPTQVLLEVTLGEDEDEPSVAKLRKSGAEMGIRNGYLQFDLTVLSGDPRGSGRSFWTCLPHPQLVVELKALNTYGTLKRSMIVSDMRKLLLARRYWATEHGVQVPVLMVVVANDTKEAKRSTEPARVVRWVDGFAGDDDVPEQVPVALLLRDRLELRSAKPAPLVGGLGRGQ